VDSRQIKEATGINLRIHARRIMTDAFRDRLAALGWEYRPGRGRHVLASLLRTNPKATFLGNVR
jgi:hypothetical protein